MELRCPDCCSPEVREDERSADALRCGNCGAHFQRDSAFVTVGDAERQPRDAVPRPLFTVNEKLAEIELRRGDGAITTISPYSDADELNHLLDGAQAAKIIGRERERAWISLHPLSIASPEPLLAVDSGVGPSLLGPELKLGQNDGEDPITYTLRVLAETVAEANGLAAELGADSARLDRIAAYMNRPGQWNGGDVCEFVATELDQSGRRLLDAE